jgi:hypothetical protein
MEKPRRSGAFSLLRAVVDDLLGGHVVSGSGYSTVAVRMHEHELAEVVCRPARFREQSTQCSSLLAALAPQLLSH